MSVDDVLETAESGESSVAIEDEAEVRGAGPIMGLAMQAGLAPGLDRAGEDVEELGEFHGPLL